MSASKNNLTLHILMAMAAGIILGAVAHGASGYAAWLDTLLTEWLAEGVFFVIGKIFVASLKVLVVPLVFISLVCGAANLGDSSQIGRMGGKTIGLYLFTTAVAISLAMGLALLVEPGIGANLESKSQYTVGEQIPFTQVLINIFPTNPISAMADERMLQIIVFALLLGVAINKSGQAGSRVKSMFEDWNEVVMKLITMLMKLAPYGVFALLFNLFAAQGFGQIQELIVYFVTVVTVLMIHGLVVYPSLFVFFTRLNPVLFFAKMRDVQLFAFSTASSNATLPITMETVEKRLGVDNKVASFSVPLGATLNMDGTAIMQGVATVFIAQAYGIDLTFAQLLTVIATATMASIGAAGVPGVGLITLSMVLVQVNLPVEGIALIIGVDRLLDMLRTAVNVTGDAAVSCIVAKSEGQLHESVFNNEQPELTKEEAV